MAGTGIEATMTLYSNGHMTDLQNHLTETTSSDASDITNAGDVVGTATRQTLDQFGLSTDVEPGPPSPDARSKC